MKQLSISSDDWEYDFLCGNEIRQIIWATMQTLVCINNDCMTDIEELVWLVK